MTLLEAIQRDIEEAPTIMCLSDEQEFCRRLMEIPEANLLEQGERVGIILDRLHESHTSVVFEVTSENDFRFFGDWARAFAGQFPDFPQSAALVALADNLESPFSM
ncbi:hypothetical protein [Pseudoxanthomonas sacheonensis]|uniref:Uncharacterized protein n=1 Tax=Pseudoxanthomonas sacheonensis TaxID=443615 RepID=A0ABU1RQY4_9GAMM|nr:hypothetical protein [Pseudoxanthomonas sacheonensis]MDR6841179.1 hypothetical protein [Pseudoxanthomonas sacheonensis]